MRATVKFILRDDYTRRDGKQRLSLRYIAHKRSSFIGLGISLLPKHWDSNALMVRMGDPLCYQYNKIISEIHQKAVNLVMDNYNAPLPIPRFRELLMDKQNNQTSFYEFAESELEVFKVDKAPGTISNYNKLLNTLKLWKPTLTFDEITLDFIERFHAYEIKQGNLESTICKKHANLKSLINRAVLKEKMSTTPYDKFPIKKNHEAQNNDILTENEVLQLYDVYKSEVYTENRQEVLRNFLFSCTTGLSYADVRVVLYDKLKTCKVNGVDYALLSSKRVKTDEIYKIPIVSPMVKDLLGSGLDFQKIFNPLSNDKSNKHLECIMQEQNIKKNITFHMARHNDSHLHL